MIKIYQRTKPICYKVVDKSVIYLNSYPVNIIPARPGKQEKELGIIRQIQLADPIIIGKGTNGHLITRYRKNAYFVVRIYGKTIP